MMTRRLSILLALLLLSGRATSAAAVTRITSQSGNWSAAATWGGNPPPTAVDDAIVDGNFTVTVDVPNAACRTLQLGGSTLGTGGGTLSFASGSQLTVAGPVTLGVTTNTPGSVTMTAGGLLACQGLVDNRLGTWTAGAGTVAFTATNTIPTNNNIDFNHLTISGGTTTISRNMTVAGNLVIAPGATLVAGASTVTCDGDWTNNGTFTGGTGMVTFARNGNQTISGTGANNFNLIRLNMGLSRANVLEVASTNFSAAPAFLQLSNGTFELSGSFPFANTFLAGPAYSIPVNAGLWIHNPNATVVAQAGSVTVVGLLRVSAGAYGVGLDPDESLVYQNAGSALTVDGGALTIAGRLCGNNSTATTTYTQSSGTVTVVGQGSTDPVFSGFDLHAPGSSFAMSGGTIVVRNATSAPADYLNGATATVTGGVLQIGDATTANAQTIRIQSTRPMGALVISGATPQATKPTAQLVGASLSVLGGVTIQPGTTFDAGGLNVALGGDWSDSGALANANTVIFNGAGPQALTNPAGETFNNVSVAKTGGTLTLNSATTVNGTASISQGTMAVGVQTLILNGAVTGGGTLTSAIAGTVQYNQASPGQTVLAAAYGNLAFSDFGKSLAPSGTIGVAGAFTPGAGAGHSVTGSTIDLDGGSQVVPTFPYHHLTLSGTGTKTGPGSLAVAGTFTNSLGVVFSGTTTLTLNGSGSSNSGTLAAATLAIAPGGGLTNVGTATVSTSLEGGGAFTQGATGLLAVGGSVTVSTLDASAPGNTVNYTGAGQTVAPTLYHHLTLSGSGSPVLAGVSTIQGTFTLAGTVSPVAGAPMTIGGDCVIQSGASFDLAGFSHVIKGNWSNAGSVIPGASTVTLNGTVAQIVTGGSFNDLGIDNPGGVALASDATVAGTLALTNGSLAIGPHTLTLDGAVAPGTGSLVGGASSNLLVGGAAASTTLPAISLGNLTLDRPSGAALGGDLSVGGALTILHGTLQTGAHAALLGSVATLAEQAGNEVAGSVRTTRTLVATSGTETFGNIGAEIMPNGVALGSTTVARTTSVLSTGAGHSSIARYFDITPSTNTHLNATWVFHYDASELNSQDAGTLELYRSRDGGASWNDLGGVVDAAAHTVTVFGVDDFSRWTAADPSHSIGPVATPTLTGIAPSARTVGDPGFTLTVSGSEFVNGKSVVRLNGSDRATTFSSPTQLSATVPATDLQVVGSVAVTVFNTGGGASTAVNLAVGAQPPSAVLVETAANGSGTIVPAQSLVAGSPITVYAIARDPLGNFVTNVAATGWALTQLTGGVVAGDLVPAADGKSAVFTAHAVGTCAIQAASGTLSPTPSGTISIIAGPAAGVRVETLANGLGVVVPSQSLSPGGGITVFAVTRDAQNNFIDNVAATAWAVGSVTGGVVASDLVPAADGKSAVFHGHAIGSCKLFAIAGPLPSVGSGVITVATPTAVDGGRPHRLALQQNVPNPFRGWSRVSFDVPDSAPLRLGVFDVFGREVARLVDEIKAPGRYTVRWDVAGMKSGTYFIRLESNGRQLVRKALLTQ